MPQEEGWLEAVERVVEAAEMGKAVAAVEAEPVAVMRASARVVARKAASRVVCREAGLVQHDTAAAAVAAVSRAQMDQEREGAKVAGR